MGGACSSSRDRATLADDLEFVIIDGVSRWRDATPRLCKNVALGASATSGKASLQLAAGSALPIILLVVLLVMALGGGGWSHSRYGAVSGSPLGIVVLLLVVLLFTGFI